MLRRLLLGLILGAIVGGLAAAALVAGPLHMALFAADTGGAILAYAAAAITGVLTGLVAGKPIWASGAKIEAGLKAFFGALLAAGLMFALRQWVHFQPDLAFLMPGVDPVDVHTAVVGAVPALALPAVAAVLGGFFELDNTGGSDADGAKGDASKSKKRVADDKANGTAKKRVAVDDADDEEAAPVAPKRAKR
jgi:hypothetical protein